MKIETSTLGVAHPIHIQERRMSCGPACVVMTAKRMLDLELKESLICEYSQAFQQTVSQSNGHIKDFGREKIGKETVPTDGYDSSCGTEAGNLSIMLRKICIDAKVEKTKTPVAAVENATLNEPVIAQVSRDASYGKKFYHWVVVDGMEADKLVISDPGFGLTEVPLSVMYSDKKGTKWTFTGVTIKTCKM